jgi:metal-responsive CopG/Arc/MetJ family transcriptional regulator
MAMKGRKVSGKTQVNISIPDSVAEDLDIYRMYRFSLTGEECSRTVFIVEALEEKLAQMKAKVSRKIMKDGTIVFSANHGENNENSSNNEGQENRSEERGERPAHGD